MAKALLRALEGGPEVAEVVDSGRDRAAVFSMAALAERYHQRYTELLER